LGGLEGDTVSSRELLLAPWSDVTIVSLCFLVLQLTLVVLGVIPSVRRGLRKSPWLSALAVGTPLLWILFETALGFIFILEVSHPQPRYLWTWLAKRGFVIGATLALQIILALQYVPRPRHRFSTVGPIAGLLAIFTDVVFVMGVIATPVGAGPHDGMFWHQGAESPSGVGYAFLWHQHTGPFLLDDQVRLKIQFGEVWCLIDKDLTTGPNGQRVDVRAVRWISDDEILVERVVSGREDDLVFNTSTHTWRSP
jgi:hypothetical protein